MKFLRVWFNKSFSSAFNVIHRLAETTVPHRFRVLCSHTNREFVGFEPAAESFVEPTGLGSEDYLHYCLEFCASNAVEVFVPGRSRISLASHRSEFESRGVRLLVPASAETLHLFEDKARFYATIAPSVAPAPSFIAVRNASEFSAAVATLRAEGCEVCLKPAASTGGLGFRILDDGRSDLRNLFGGENIRITTALAAHILAQEEEFRPLLVMEYLSGAEYSVDCLAVSGRLLCAVPRRKSSRIGGAQLLENRPELISLSERVAAAYELDGIFNVQVRYHDGVAKVLEINARMSGGIYFACLSGVDLPAWAIALAAGTASPVDVPQPQFGIAVHQQYREFVLTNPHGAAVP
jgi:biotin carboxylase